MELGRMYSVEFDNVAVTVATDFFEIVPADDKPCIVHAVFVGQSTELGDAAEEQLRVRIIRLPATFTSGSGGAAPTPAPLNDGTAAAGFVSETMNTTVATTSGTAINLHSDTFNVRTGFVWIPTPEMRPTVRQAAGLVVRLVAAPADSITFSGTLYVEEI